MWPLKLDMTREECRGVLRRLELESYGTVISTFRAQGCLSKEKIRILEDLRRMFHITTDRHRAEARRVANDERLATVAEIISGPNSGQDWRREGHRTFPVLPRTVPHTALTYIANTVYEQLTRANTKLPHPADTSCDRLKKAEEMLKFELVKKSLSLYENGFVRDAAVVTSDPLQDIMSKSYINREENRPAAPKPVENAPMEAEPDVAVIPNGGGEVPSAPAEPDPEQSSLCEILLNLSNHRPENSETKPLDKCNKSADRSPRKKPQAKKRAWKAKIAYPPAKLSKQALPKNVKQSTRVNNMHSPHLIHSYAVPFDAHQGNATNGNAASEPPQLQQHLTSNNVPQSGQQNNHGTTMGPPVKSKQFATPAPGGTAQSTTYSHQQGVLPSSKKDIQYNLSKLNPTSNLPAKGNVNIPLKGAGFYAHGKSLPHPLLNYQKKSPSKNILIPTSTAAATLASLGFPSPFHPPLMDHSSNWLGVKNRDKTVKNVKTNPTTSMTATATAETATERSNATGIKHGGKRMEVSTERIEHSAEQSSHAKTVTFTSPAVVESPITKNASLPTTQENVAGSAAPKSGSKVLVQPMPLIPASGAAQSTTLTSTVQKNNVFILPKSAGVTGVLNLGQKIAIPKSMVDASSAASTVASPPKVIVQTMPGPYSSTTSAIAPMLETDAERKNVSQSSRVMMGVDEKTNNTISNATTMRTGESTVDVRNEGKLQAVTQDCTNAPLKQQSQTPSFTIPFDGVSGRKIKISTSQLVPFTGTLHASSMAKGTGCITIGAKKIKIGTDDELASELNRSTITENSGIPKANDAIGSSNSNEPKTTKPPTDRIETETVATVQHFEEAKVEVPTKEDNQRTSSNRQDSTSSADNTLAARFSDTSALSPTQDAMDTSQGEYEIVATEQDDDSSATDSADAEDDLDDEPSQIEETESIEEDNFEEDHNVEVEMGTDAYIIEEEQVNYDYLIEEVPEDEQFVEEVEDDGPVEFISVGYGTTGELVAELESGTSSQQIIEKQHRSANGVVREEIPPEIDYDQHTGGFGPVGNGDMQAFAVENDIVCDLLVMGPDGKYHARPYSYKQVLAERMDSASKAAKQTHPIVRLS
ncbi:BRCA2-interacting transcriptional repressor EMSY [Anopheles gambiae]|uniref:BRCA2-interacting transcriptional repressor EMSY n=1 Tax=Anopheles gambiae TaxID=7165 RepID=UPI002AC9120F|nr:BRCA2-interacting transcriptional repressor EMSY [Anopheles gambiae]